MLLNVGRRLFLDRRHNDFQSLRAGSVQHEERKPPVAGDQSEFLRHWLHNPDFASNQAPVASYLITPRCDVSMNRTSISTSSPSPPSSRNFSSACEVFSLEASSRRNAWCSSLIRSGEKPRRCKPTLFNMKACVSRSALVIE